MNTLRFDLSKEGNKFKILNATNGGPWHKRHANDQGRSNFSDYKAARIPYSRNHDSCISTIYGGPYSHDISAIFPNFDADVNYPASYDFACTDESILICKEAGTETFFRLGQTIEHQIVKHHVFPPKDFKKWAQICEHIIMHYNEGWANGYNYGITYWEIWNEPDVVLNPNNIAQTWHGTREEFFEFYKTAATHLKKCFGDSIMVGGYASMGFAGFHYLDPDATGVKDFDFSTNDFTNPEYKRAYRVDYAHKFLAFVRDNNLPLDFFSWHCYTNVGPSMILACEKHCRRVLANYGFEHVPDILNEWSAYRQDARLRGTPKVAADTLAVLLGSQRNEVDMLCYYDAGFGVSVYKGLWNPLTFTPFPTYYAFKSFNQAYKLKNEIATASFDEEVYVLGARNDEKGVIIIANTKDESVTLDFEVAGIDIDSAEVIATDEEYLYTMLDDMIKDKRLTVKAHSMIEIRTKF
jgi:hypothetical protein